jgi:GNAT superfamily N-acetyltransferase
MSYRVRDEFLRDLWQSSAAELAIKKRGFSKSDVIIRRERRSDGVIGGVAKIGESEVAFCEVIRVPHKYCGDCRRYGPHIGSTGKKFLIEEFDVVPLLQGLGIGRILYDWIERQARRKKIEEIWLRVNPGSEGFWKKMGFNPKSNIEPSGYASKQLASVPTGVR